MGNQDITEQLTNLAMHGAQNKHKWKEKEEKFEDDILRLNEMLAEKESQNEILNEEMEAVMTSKVDTVSNINKQINELRLIIKSQQKQLECLQNKGVFDDLWGWSK